MELRVLLRAPRADPSQWWTSASKTRMSRPIVSDLFLDSCLGANRLSEYTSRKMHDRCAILSLKNFLTSNSQTQGAKRAHVISEDDSNRILSSATGQSWKDPKTPFECVGGAFNFLGAVHQTRTYSYEGICLLAVLHQVRFFRGIARSNKDQIDILVHFMNSVFSTNKTRASSGQAPADFKKVLELAKASCVFFERQESLLQQGDPYSVEGSNTKSDLDRLKAQVVAELKGQTQPGNRGGHTAGRAARPGRGGGRARGRGGRKGATSADKMASCCSQVCCNNSSCLPHILTQCHTIAVEPQPELLHRRGEGLSPGTQTLLQLPQG